MHLKNFNLVSIQEFVKTGSYPQTGCKVVDKTLSKTNSLTFR